MITSLKIFFNLLFKKSKTCPWLWPRPILSLALRDSVLEKLVLGFGLEFFSVLGLKHCVLDSRSASNIKHVTSNLNVMIDDHDNKNNLY